MHEFVFQNPSALMWLLLVPVLLLVFYATHRWRHRLALFDSKQGSQQKWGPIFSLLSVVFAILALARPGFDPVPREVFSSGRDVVFLLDVSKSMLAEDILPSRLERAKMAIMSTLDTLNVSDRVALVLFSGSATVISPLTNDFSFFRKSVMEASRHSVALGGTKLSAALIKSSEKVFTEDSKGVLDVVVLTDGEDQDSDLDLAVKVLNKNESQLILVGFGDRLVGSRIKQKDGTFLVEDDREVWTKMKSGVLEALAEKCTDGLFLDVGTKSINLGDVYQQIVKHKSNKKASKGKQLRYRELYQYFLFVSIVLLVCAGGYSSRKSRKLKLPLLLILFGCSSLLNAADLDGFGSHVEEMEKAAQNMASYIVASRATVEPEVLNKLNSIEAYNQGCEFLEKKSYFKALLYFDWAEKTKHQDDHDFEIRYNRATCYFYISKKGEELGVLKESIANAKNALKAYQSLFLNYPHNQKLLVALEATYLQQQNLLDQMSDKSQEQADNNEDSDNNSDEEGDEEGESNKDAESSDKMEVGKPTDKAKKMEGSLKTPEDILQEEMENNAQRDKGDENSKPMKNDW